jgi:uncharacterized protein (UPF0248 family)
VQPIFPTFEIESHTSFLKPQPNISDTTFWDINPSTLFFDEAAEWVVLRVFDRGSLEEVLSVVKYYGNEQVKNILTSQQSYLPNHTILLAKAIFQIQFNDFACLKEKPFHLTLSDVLNRLMLLPALSSHRLVGGTALALQIGHRISVDIALFSDSASDYTQVEQQILGEFGADAQVLHYPQSTLGKGISLIINGVKTDILDWNKSFRFDTVKMNGIRLANLPQIAAMKLDIITNPPEYVRYEKKDFVDIAFLLVYYSLAELIGFFRQQNPQLAYPDRLVLEALQLAELADKKPHPRMLVPLDWQATKAKINAAVRNQLSDL